MWQLQCSHWISKITVIMADGEAADAPMVRDT
jgi:hypothetical protein